MRTQITCLNGTLMPANEAMLPISDRGFRFGDGVFETISLVHGVPLHWELHMQRLAEGLDALRISAPSLDWQAHAQQVLHANHAREGALRISISRGDGSLGYLPHPRSLTANWAIEYLPARPLPFAPYRLWISSYARAPLCALPVNSKLSQGVGSTLALLEATENNCDEALQLSTNGVVCCGASASIFWIKGRAVFTPSLSTGCLSGITRGIVMSHPDIATHECESDLATLEHAEAVFIASSRLGVWPVSEIQPADYTFHTDHPIFEKILSYVHRQSELYINNNSNEWVDK